MRLYKKRLTAVLLVFTIVLLAFLWKKPWGLALWKEDVSVLALVEISEDESTITFKGIRDWRYAKEKVLSRDYTSEVFRVKDLEKIWYYVQPLNSSGWLAHTFVVFEFKNADLKFQSLGISLEARKKQSQEYSMLKGIFKGFTLVHVWATAEDLVSRREVYSTYDLPLERHEIQLSEEDKVGLLKAYARETNALHQAPEFYNTLAFNCTSALAHYANTIKPGAIPWHYSFILTGKSVEYLRSLGYIE